MNGFLIFLFASFLSSTAAGKHNIYSGYTVHSIKLRNELDQKILYEQQFILNVDVWEYGVAAVRDALVMVSPENRLKFLDTLDQNDISHHLHISDVAQALEDNDAEVSTWKMSRSNSIFQNYPTYAEVDAYLERIAQANPGIVTLVNAGNSFQGRAVKYLKISTSNFNDKSKPIYFLDATMHAREWITTPPALYAVHRLVEDLQVDDTDLLNEIDWIVLPIVNPDGYEYSHTTDRLWRRTRSYNATRSLECYGVDANRNFDVNFDGVGSSTEPCDTTFRGHEPFSEPETGYVRDILLEHIDRIQVYLNVHSHGNLILYGYGDRSYPSNAVHLHLVGSSMGAAIDNKKLLEAPFYVVGNSARVLYFSSGSAQDYGQVMMFLSYEIFATFGVSALVSFFVSATLLLAVASKRGLLRPQRKDALMPQIYDKQAPSAPELALLTQSN